MKKDSLEITTADRSHIVERVTAASERRILVTHGTDSMAQTAEALKAVTGKVIVLTGAMQPARMRSSDAFFNLGCAVYIAMNGRVFPAGSVRKNRAERRFEAIGEQPTP